MKTNFWSLGVLLLSSLFHGSPLAAAPNTAVEFPPNLPWLNVSRPLTMQELQGKAVILDFWTYGCVNCMHVIPELRKLEDKYGERLVVISVHSPKFDNEKRVETLRNIVIRYDMEHPVVNDVDFSLWRAYGVRAWPTLVVIDPAGTVITKVAGEGHYALLDNTVANALKNYQGKPNLTALPAALEKNKLAQSILAAPGKIALSLHYVAISDTLHHRIILTDHDGKILQIYGGIQAGWRDGDPQTVRFSSPQGLVFTEEGLYVADTGNHSIRLLNLETHQTKTVAGTGQQGGYVYGYHDALSTSLRSPWDLAYAKPMLYIAMAGSHQIWRLHTGTKKIGPYAGSGREDLLDGALKEAAFSQPSGLSLHGDWLYVADAEDSAIRRIHLREQQVQTLIGTGLFDFGDKDGPFAQAKLQHVLGIAALDPQHVLIADTYNHKIKQLDLNKKVITTLVGSGTPGPQLAGSALRTMLNEPGGMAVYNGAAYIADTNNHRILKYDLAAKRLSLWTITP